MTICARRMRPQVRVKMHERAQLLFSWAFDLGKRPRRQTQSAANSRTTSLTLRMDCTDRPLSHSREGRHGPALVLVLGLIEPFPVHQPADCSRILEGMAAISRWLSAATPPDAKTQYTFVDPGRDRSARLVASNHMLRPLRGRRAFAIRFQGYRCAQPLANGCDPHGVQLQAAAIVVTLRSR